MRCRILQSFCCVGIGERRKGCRAECNAILPALPTNRDASNDTEQKPRWVTETHETCDESLMGFGQDWVAFRVLGEDVAVQSQQPNRLRVPSRLDGSRR